MCPSGATATPWPSSPSSSVPQIFCQTTVPAESNLTTKRSPGSFEAGLKLLSVPPATYTLTSAATATPSPRSDPVPPHQVLSHARVPFESSCKSTASPPVAPVTYTAIPTGATATSPASSPSVSGPGQVRCQTRVPAASYFTRKMFGEFTPKLCVVPARYTLPSGVTATREATSLPTPPHVLSETNVSADAGAAFSTQSASVMSTAF